MWRTFIVKRYQTEERGHIRNQDMSPNIWPAETGSEQKTNLFFKRMLEMKVGVLALQGAFREHEKLLAACGVEPVQIRKPQQLDQISALVIPGGESTTIGKLMNEFKLFEPVVKLGREGLPLFGTCAGLILLARDITGSAQPRIGLMDICVERNAFGRQVDSFEASLDIPAIGMQPFRAVFIRAPYILTAGSGVEVLARFQEKIVFARQGRLLAAAFHPELTGDIRIHQFFLDKCVQAS